MRIWSVDGLRSDISAGRFGQKDVIRYWIAWIFLLRFLFPTQAGSLDTPGYIKTLFFCVSLLISVFGAIACYRANGGKDGERLMDKVTAFMVLMQIRGIIFAYVPVCALLAVLMIASGFEGDGYAFLAANPQYLLLSIIYYQAYVYRGISRQLRLLKVLG